ncbi:ferritin family protein [Candidatus Woesearchaeota archaeon]|nr:ferritin family protein [Candidatus Woesearchaeota archaeon]
MDIKEALQTALDFEEKGHQIYEETANKSENPIVAKTFRYLADQELVHIEEIKEYIGILNSGQEIELKGDKLEDTKKFFSTTTEQFKKKTELSDDDLKAHETALELEKKSYDFYKEQNEQADKPELKKFFSWLMEQENAHYALIQNAYEYIKNPEQFFAEEEKWIVEG